MGPRLLAFSEFRRTAKNSEEADEGTEQGSSGELRRTRKKPTKGLNKGIPQNCEELGRRSRRKDFTRGFQRIAKNSHEADEGLDKGRKKTVWRAALGPRDALSIGKSNWVGTNFQNGMIDLFPIYLTKRCALDTTAIGRRSINPVASNLPVCLMCPFLFRVGCCKALHHWLSRDRGPPLAPPHTEPIPGKPVAKGFYQESTSVSISSSVSCDNRRVSHKSQNHLTGLHFKKNC